MELMMLNEQLKRLRGERTCLLALSMVLISAQHHALPAVPHR